MFCHTKKKLFYGRFETKFWKWKYNFMMVLLMDAVMHGLAKRRYKSKSEGFFVSVLGSERKRFEEEEEEEEAEEGSELESRGKKKKGPN